MRAIQAIKSSSSLFPPIVNKFKPHDSPTRNNKDSQQYHHPIKDRERDLSLPPIKNSQMNNATQSSLKKYKKIKYLGKGSYGAALLVCLR